MIEVIRLPDIGRFYTNRDFEEAIRGATFGASNTQASHVNIVIGKNSRFLAGVTLKLLCLCHHVVSCNFTLSLTFKGADCGCYTFLERCGFFRALPQAATVTPLRPCEQDASVVFARNSSNLLEIREISPSEASRNRPIPGELTDALGALIRTNCETFLSQIQTVVSEFCGNVPEHSQAPTPGFVYMLHYPRTKNIQICVADIGVGLLNSLREGLVSRGHHLKDESDETLILEMFNRGLSRKGERRGTGLNQAAKIAIQYKGTLHVRLDRHIIDLQPKGDVFAEAFIEENCSIAKGTHITFSFSTENIN